MKKLFFALAAIMASTCVFAQVLPYQNANLSPSERADDLLSRLSLEQKVSLMMNQSAAVPEFGIHYYGWWNESLHGCARSGLATMFPQAIGMAASWDNALLEKVFTIASEEQRMKYIQCIQEKGGADQYSGLTVWTPNINIFRDPRWGRGQETYGEDPYLMFIMGKAVVEGLQGQPDEKGYDRLHACLKHYAVHSGPESERHTFDADNISYRDLMETYLYAFENIVKTTDVQEVMCAYQRFEGKPCCGSDKLLTKILREDWGYKGLVVSDCGAVHDFYREGGHRSFEDAKPATASAVKSGTDLECGGSYSNLVAAVKEGYITEDEIDVSVKRLLVARFRLGDMDPFESVSWNKLPLENLASDESRAVSLDMARESMTLLQNNGTLPLSKSLKVAVIGPNANDEAVMKGNYYGTPKDVVTVLEGIKAKLGEENVIYARGCERVAGEDERAPYQTTEEFFTNDGSKAKGFDGAAEFDVAALADVDAVIYVGGISGALEGEEMDVPFDGFLKGDRTNIELPEVQRTFIAELSKCGKPVVFVNMSGSAIALSPESAVCDAILQAWYPGEAGGTAVADVLFGDYNPAGRLPVTFYASSDQLPDFKDYDMAGRTYRYFEGQPLFPFGYGLSYSNFKYGRAALVNEAGKKVRKFSASDNLTLKVPVSNKSAIDGDEVVQVYIKSLNDVDGPIYALKGFCRKSIAAGAKTVVEIPLNSLSFSYFNEATGKMEPTPGKYIIYYGKSSAPKDLKKLKVRIR